MKHIYIYIFKRKNYGYEQNLILQIPIKTIFIETGKNNKKKETLNILLSGTSNSFITLQQIDEVTKNKKTLLS